MQIDSVSVEKAGRKKSWYDKWAMIQLIFGCKPKSVLQYEFSQITKSQLDLALTSTLVINYAATTVAIVSLALAEIYGSSDIAYYWFLAISIPFLFNFSMLWRCYHLRSQGRLSYNFFIGVHMLGGLVVGLIWGGYPAILSQVLGLDNYLIDVVYMCAVFCGLGWCFPTLQPAVVMVTAMIFSYIGVTYLNPFDTPNQAPFLVVFCLLGGLYVFLMCALSAAAALFVRWVKESFQANQQSHMLRMFVNDFEESATDWIWQTNTSGYIDYVSDRLTQLTGLDIAQLENLRLTDIFEEYSVEAQQLGKYLDQRKKFINFKIPVVFNGISAWWSLTGKPIFNEFGDFAGFRGVGSDVSKEMEIEKIESNREFYEAFIKISSILSHDFNNLLASVMIRLEFIRDRSNTQEVTDYAEEGLYICKKAANITSQMLAYSKKHSLHPKNVQVNEILTILKDEIGGQGKDIQLEITALDTFYVWSDETLLYTSLTNVINNAVREIEDGGCIYVGIEYQTITNQLEGLEPGNYVHISIEDTGAGFKAEELLNGQAFEPFYTTNRDSGGSGLGLSMVQGFARQSGGNAFISNGRHGGRVDLYFLAGEKQNEPAELQNQVNKELHILLVEDNEDVGLLLVEFLKNLGHKAHSAASFAEAKAVFSENQHIDLVISDFMLPDGNGSDVSQFVRDLKPNIAFMFISGFLNVPLEGDAKKDIVLVKPFTLAELSKAIDNSIQRLMIET